MLLPLHLQWTAWLLLVAATMVLHLTPGLVGWRDDPKSAAYFGLGALKPRSPEIMMNHFTARNKVLGCRRLLPGQLRQQQLLEIVRDALLELLRVLGQQVKCRRTGWTVDEVRIVSGCGSTRHPMALPVILHLDQATQVELNVWKNGGTLPQIPRIHIDLVVSINVDTLW